MNKIIIIPFAAILLLSCNNFRDTNQVDKVINDSVSKSKFSMYEMSEMALLMEQMYAYNTQLKDRILNDRELGEYPSTFDKIHTATLTESNDRDDFFNQQAFKFIEAQQEIYKNPKQAKANFNAMVKQCLECHAKKCGGPVPRIKKLLIP